MQLKKIIECVKEARHIKGRDTLSITGITADSKKVKPGYVFVAVRGVAQDGHLYLEHAVQKGAVAVVVEDQEFLTTLDCVQYVVEDTRRALSKLLAAFYKNQPENIVMVTGTNGKTSTTYFVQQIWQELGIDSAGFGTLGINKFKAGERIIQNNGLTTPNPEVLYKELAGLVEEKINHVVMEASSHGIEQRRLEDVKVTAAAFTNFSRDHLDYHKTTEAYFAAKARLFEELLPKEGTAILNADISEYKKLLEICNMRGIKVISYGKNAEDLIFLAQNKENNILDLKIMGEDYQIKFPLVGEFQVYNALAALGMVLSHSNEVKKAVKALETLTYVPGRLEFVGAHPKGANIYVDYAHTPEALEIALKTLRPYAKGQLKVVFGCGGDRDKGKRPIMGAVAQENSDLCYVTDDNPRTEKAAMIRRDILENCKGVDVPGRKNAIERAILDLNSDDVLLIAGKGHETGQIIGEKTHPFNDKVVVRKILREIKE